MQLIFLLVMHHIADVWAQPSWLIENKKKHAFAIYEHVMIYAGILTFVFWLAADSTILIFLWFFVGHFLIDFVKYQVLPKMNDGEHKYWWIYVDQLLHYSQIIIPYLWYTNA